VIGVGKKGIEWDCVLLLLFSVLCSMKLWWHEQNTTLAMLYEAGPPSGVEVVSAMLIYTFCPRLLIHIAPMLF
jgi:hypothetical protein